MIIALARAIVHLSAPLVPRAQRARFREEWLAELDAAPANLATLRRALGAPRDAMSTHTMNPTHPTSRSSWSAWSTDMKYASRQLLRRPGHTVAVIACLGIGIAASVGTFSVLTSLLYGDLPGLADRKSIARVYLGYDSATGTESVAGGRQVTAELLSLSDFAIMRQVPTNATTRALAAEGQLRMTAAGLHGALLIEGAFVSGDFFPTLQSPAQLGRLLRPEDEAPGAPPVAVVADHFWRTQLDARPDAIGQTILAGGQSFTVVGVAVTRFHGTRPLEPGRSQAEGTQVWLPLPHVASWPSRPADEAPWLETIARLQSDETIDRLERVLAVNASRLATETSARRDNATVVARTTGFGGANQPGFLLFVLALVMGLPLTVLAIGCANVANLQLARSAERARELAVRLSLGATRGQLVRLLTLETLARTVTAVGMAVGVVAIVLSYAQPLMPVTLAIDWRAGLFAAILSIAVSFGTGLMPAWLVLRTAAAGQLKQNAQGGGLSHSRMRSALVVVQVALSLTLLSVTAIFIRTIQQMEASAPPALVEQTVAEFDTAALGLAPRAARQFADTLAEQLSSDGRVSDVAVSQSRSVRYGDPVASRTLDRPASLVELTPSWFRVMDVHLLAGRALTAADTADVGIVSAALADLVTPGGSPLGQTLLVEDGERPRRLLIVGVAADFAARPAVERPAPVIYTPLPATLSGAFLFRVRSSAHAALTGQLQAQLNAIDPRYAWTRVRRGDSAYLGDATEMRAIVPVIAACGAIALLLAATGLYAVISYVVTLRRREIGVRLAIGANPKHIAILVLRQAGRLVAVGTVVGLGVAGLVAMALRASFVAPVDILDPVAYVPNALLLIIVALLAAAIPARRAASVDPVTTLRQE